MNSDFTCEYDVVVAGGGVAGVAAAVQAARLGHKTALIEKTVFLGGLATSGLIYVYLPLCDGRGHQVISGISEEMLKASMKYGPGDIPAEWKDPDHNDLEKRYQVVFSPASFTLVLDEMCENAGVDLWFDTLVCAAGVNSGNQVKSVFVENKSGRGRIDAKIFIDASGDADLARRAGAKTESSCNHLSSWVLEYNIKARKKYMVLGDKLGLHILYEPTPQDASKSEKEKFLNINGKKVSRFILDSRKRIREHYQSSYDSGKFNRNDLFPVSLPSMPSFRMTYAVYGKDTLTDRQDGIRFENSVGLAGDWRKIGPIWEIPYGVLVPEKIKGLLTAGRCISTLGDAWDVMRVIPTAALTGQVAGMAASLSITNNTLPDEIDVKLIQNELRNAGFLLHLSDIAEK